MDLPGKLGEIKGISFAITEKHNEVFPYWSESKLKNVSLIHIDSHSDLADQEVPINFFDNKDYYTKLDVGGFICPAVHYGIIKDMLWISPFQIGNEIYIQYLNKELLETKTKFFNIKWKKLSENVNGTGISSNIEDGGFGESLKPKQLREFQRDNQYILDIDLDAFAKEIIGPPTQVEIIKSLCPGIGITGWEERITKTEKLLKMLPKPDLITLTRSQGRPNFVPSDMVDKVQEKTTYMLNRLYFC